MANTRTHYKRQAQKNLLHKRQDACFIAEYVKRKAPDIYAEAEGFLKTLKQRYPTKRDCTKTHEFMVSTTEYNSYEEYYRRKKPQCKESSVRKTAFVDNMSISIPLLPENVVAENVAPLQLVSEEISEEIVREITSDPILRDIFNDFSNLENDIDLDGIELDPSVTGLSPLEKELL